MALQSQLDADKTPLPILRLTISCGASRKKNAPPWSMISQQTHRHGPAAQRCHCYFCKALDTDFEQHHHR
jgi:hypothetical protein